MPYADQKRRVIYQKAPPDPVVCKPKNIIVQWEQPDVCVKKDIKHLGIVCANPCEYLQKFGSSLKRPCDLPQFIKDIPPQCGVELAANKKPDPCPVFELCGDVCALNKVNLDKEGLGMYKNQVREKCGCPPPPSPAPAPPCPPPCNPCADFNPCDCPASCPPPCPPPCPPSCPPSCPAPACNSCSGSGSAQMRGSVQYGSGSASNSGLASNSTSAIYGGSMYGSNNYNSRAAQYQSMSSF
jgi:hypothetical protein